MLICRKIKLLEHDTKVVERIFKYRIQQQIEIDDLQFGFMKWKRTNDIIFIAKQMQENPAAKGKLCGFEKSFC